MFIGVKKSLKVTEAEILKISKLARVLTGEAGDARVSHGEREKSISNYGNVTFNNMPINIGNTACSMTEVLHQCFVDFGNCVFLHLYLI